MPASTETPSWWAICLCAGWCGVCREWEPAFAAEARHRPGVAFAWVDVEDEDEAMEDVDVETFPTVLVARGGQVLFLGPIAPSAAQFGRMLDTLRDQPVPSPSLPAQAQALFERLQATVLARRRI